MRSLPVLGCLLFSLILTFGGCAENTEKKSPRDSEILALIKQGSQLQDDINKRRVLAASSTRQKSRIVSLIVKIKNGLIRLEREPNDRNTVIAVARYIREIQNFKTLRPDTTRINSFVGKVSDFISTKSQNMKLDIGDISYPVFTANFGNGLWPLVPRGGPSQWQNDVNLNENTFALVKSAFRKSTDSWLVTPAFDFSTIDKPAVQIEHMTFVSANSSDEFDRLKILGHSFKLKISTNYEGGDPNAEGVRWDELNLGEMPDTQSFMAVSSPEIDLSRYIGEKNVTIALNFNYPVGFGGHFVRWQVNRMVLYGLNLPLIRYFPSSLIKMGTTSPTNLSPFTAINLEEKGHSFSAGSFRERSFGQIFMSGKKSNAWLFSPRFLIDGQEQLKLKIRETFKNPTWENFKIFISNDYVGGNPEDSTWFELNHRQFEDQVQAGRYSNVLAGPYDLSELSLKPTTGEGEFNPSKPFVVGFQFIDEIGKRGGVWQISEIEIEGIGETIEFEQIETSGLIKSNGIWKQ